MRKRGFVRSLPFATFVIFWGCLDAPHPIDSTDNQKDIDLPETQQSNEGAVNSSNRQRMMIGDAIRKSVDYGPKRIIGNPHKTNQIIVKFKQPLLRNGKNSRSILQKNIQNLFSSAHLKNLTKVKTIGNLGIVVLKNLDPNTSMEEHLHRLSDHPLVEYAEPDWPISVNAIPSDPLFLKQWAWRQESGIDIMAPAAWEMSRGANSVVVGVIDTGIDYTHEDLAANMWRNPGEIPDNGIDDDNNGYVDDVHGMNALLDTGDPMDDNYHGTHCAGVIGAVGNNQVGVTGACWNVRLMALKFLDAYGTGLTSNAITCIDYAIEMGARILNNSWGSEERSIALREAISRAEKAGILFVAAAGNDAENSDDLPKFPAAMTNENILSVASINRFDQLSHFSNYGPESIDIAAPGSDILSTFPTSKTSEMLREQYPTHYHLLSGTSMAAPHVAGVAALLLANDSTLTWQAIKDILLRTGTKRPYLSGKIVSGSVLNAKYALMNDTPPSVAFANIDSTAIVSGIVPLEIAAADDKGVAKVEVFVDEILLGIDDSFPYTISWNTKELPDRTRHSVEARVTDTAGRSDFKKITVMINNSSEPAVYLHSVSPEVLYRTATPIEVAIQSDKKIEKAELYIDNVLIDTDESPPWSFHWNTPAFASGQHVVTVRAYKNAKTKYEDSVTVHSQQGIPLEEREALLALYNRTDGDSWRRKTNWKKKDGTFNDWGTEQTWHGILLNGNQVGHIMLSDNNLRGTLPMEISSLKNLVTLNMWNNALIGPFPSFLKECTRLKSLDLGSNELSGGLPPEIGQIIRLEYLDLEDNDFVGGIPEEISKLKQLEILSLGWNRLTGWVPRELAALPKLEQLLVNCNQLKGEVPSYYLEFPDGFFFGYNALYTHDEGLEEALNQKYPFWKDTQTLPPENVSAVYAGDGILLTWKSVEWQDSGGFGGDPNGPRRYRIYHSTVPGGPYSLLAETADAKESSLKVGSLDNTSVHYFVVTLFSPIFHWVQQIKYEIESEYSEEVIYSGLDPSDSTPPAILSVIPPNGRREEGDVWLSMDATDVGSGIAWLSMEVIHQETLSRVELFESDRAPISHVWDTQQAADGVYKISFRAYDRSGNIASKETTIEIDNHQDDDVSPAIVWITPTHGSIVNGLTEVGLNAVDPLKGPSSYFRISAEIIEEKSGATVKRFSASPLDPNYFIWNSNQVQNGEYTVLFKAFDMAGNMASKAASLTVANRTDNTPPSIVYAAPADGEVADGTVELVIDAMDTDNNLSQVSVEVLETQSGIPVAFFESKTSPANFFWDTTQVENGEYTALFRAADYQNNSATREVGISVKNRIVDVTPPTLGSFWPREGDVLMGNVELQLSADDAQSGIFKLTLEVVQPQSDTSVAFYESNTSPAQHFWDSQTVPDGDYSIRYRAVDNLGNEKSRVIFVTVDNIDDAQEQPAPEYRISKAPDFSTHNENFETYDVLYLKAWDPVIDVGQIKKAIYTLEVADFSDSGNLEYRDGVFWGAFEMSRYPIQGAPQEGRITVELEDDRGKTSQQTVFFLLWPGFGF